MSNSDNSLVGQLKHGQVNRAVTKGNYANSMDLLETGDKSGFDGGRDHKAIGDATSPDDAELATTEYRKTAALYGTLPYEA
jgi:hypothetical protein